MRVLPVRQIDRLAAGAGRFRLARSGAIAPPATVPTNAAQIRKLTAAQAAQAIPVHLRGVVISEAAPREHAIILADETAGNLSAGGKKPFRPLPPEGFIGHRRRDRSGTIRADC